MNTSGCVYVTERDNLEEWIVQNLHLKMSKPRKPTGKSSSKSCCVLSDRRLSRSLATWDTDHLGSKSRVAEKAVMARTPVTSTDSHPMEGDGLVGGSVLSSSDIDESTIIDNLPAEFTRWSRG